jgi:multidrug efflux pump subunit AcrA (membrane-fusion protein)
LGIFADRMAELDVQLRSPDGNIFARLTAGDRFAVWFAEGSYHRYTESGLEQQLGSLARAVLVKRRRAKLDALSAALGHRVRHGSSRPDGPRERRFREEQASVVGVGSNAYVEIYASPGTFWTIQIKQGALARLDESQFLMELHGAVSLATADLRRQLLQLREEVYGQRLPAWPREEG